MITVDRVYARVLSSGSNRSIGANAFAVMTSGVGFSLWIYSAILAVTTVRLCRPMAVLTSAKKRVFLYFDSTAVTSMSVLAIAIGMLGRPDPDPMSRIRLVVFGIRFNILRLSSIWNCNLSYADAE